MSISDTPVAFEKSRPIRSHRWIRPRKPDSAMVATVRYPIGTALGPTSSRARSLLGSLAYWGAAYALKLPMR